MFVKVIYNIQNYVFNISEENIVCKKRLLIQEIKQIIERERDNKKKKEKRKKSKQKLIRTIHYVIK